MISPSLLNVGYFFIAVPIWELEHADPPATGCAAPAGAPESPEAGDAAPNLEAPHPAGDADGICDGVQVAMRYVFKGHRWQAVPTWDCEANPQWNRWVENRSDEAADRARLEMRLRQAAKPEPGKPLGGAGAPAADGD